MNIIQMMNLKDCCRFLKRCKWIPVLLFPILFSTGLHAQSAFIENDLTQMQIRYERSIKYEKNKDDKKQQSPDNEFPDPGSVLLKSVMVPGWGQVTNGQAWKVPIVYGLLTGTVLYTRYLTKQYHDYRAAFFNETRGEDSDFRFGRTPSRLDGLNSDQLRSQRDSFRNQRDFMYVVVGLAYGLNVLDAYIFAHMKSFDVSDDLSASASLQPGLIDGRPAGVTFSISLKGNSD